MAAAAAAPRGPAADAAAAKKAAAEAAAAGDMLNFATQLADGITKSLALQRQRSMREVQESKQAKAEREESQEHLMAFNHEGSTFSFQVELQNNNASGQLFMVLEIGPDGIGLRRQTSKRELLRSFPFEKLVSWEAVDEGFLFFVKKSDSKRTPTVSPTTATSERPGRFFEKETDKNCVRFLALTSQGEEMAAAMMQVVRARQAAEPHYATELQGDFSNELLDSARGSKPSGGRSNSGSDSQALYAPNIEDSVYSSQQYD